MKRSMLAPVGWAAFAVVTVWAGGSMVLGSPAWSGDLQTQCMNRYQAMVWPIWPVVPHRAEVDFMLWSAARCQPPESVESNRRRRI